MPFDDHRFPSPAAARLRRNRRRVAIWLFTVAFMIFGMVLLGGATRVTGSGLSIMEWAPLSGALPPLSHAAWQRLFAEYRAIPQYSLLHPGMNLAGFRHIFWLEWAHRLWGRLIGVVFLIPLVVFAVSGAIERRLVPRLVLLFVLGGLQGAVGWFMVASGFAPESTAVAPARLALHLALALTLYAAIVWTALSTITPAAPLLPQAGALKRTIHAVLGLTALTIVAGGLTAGAHAGLIDNSFPLMDGRLVPSTYSVLEPLRHGLVASPESIQFDHRLLATLTALATLAAFAMALRTPLPPAPRRAVLSLVAAALLQYGLGVATLLLVVPAPLALLHQANAVLLLSAALVSAHTLRRAGARAATPPPGDNAAAAAL